jgi:hypothetical protein
MGIWEISFVVLGSGNLWEFGERKLLKPVFWGFWKYGDLGNSGDY